MLEWVLPLDGGKCCFTPPGAFPREKSSRHPLNTRLGGTKIQSGLFAEEKNILSLSGIEPGSLVHPVIILTALSRLSVSPKTLMAFWAINYV
jgi:hypothetical protein